MSENSKAAATLDSGNSLPESKSTSEQEALAQATHRHYKGGLYRMLGVAKHSETLEPMVVYQHLWPHEPGFWVRPEEMFHGNLEDGRRRFTPL